METHRSSRTAFEKKYLKEGPNQISYVTNDLNRAMDFLRTTFGIPRFLTVERMELGNQQFQTQSASMMLSFAIAWTGTLFLNQELLAFIQPQRQQATA